MHGCTNITDNNVGEGQTQFISKHVGEYIYIFLCVCSYQKTTKWLPHNGAIQLSVLKSGKKSKGCATLSIVRVPISK